MSLVAYTASDGESSADDADPEDESLDVLHLQYESNDNAKMNDLAVDDLKSPAKESNEPVKEIELEDYVKPKSSQSCEISKPKVKKRKQTVKIGIPALQEDSDEEDDQKPAKKKVLTSAGRCGLTSLLPPPVNAVKKEANRILIPHSLKKNPSQRTDKAPHVDPIKSVTELPKIPLPSTTILPQKSLPSTSISATKPSLVSNYLSLYGSDSDEEEETSQSSNFFSLDSTGKTVTSKSVQLVNTAPSVSTSAHDTLQEDTASTSLNLPSLTNEQPPPTPPHPNAPLMFKSPSNSSSMGSTSYQNDPLVFKPNSSNLMKPVPHVDAPHVFKGNNSNSLGPVSHQAEENETPICEDIYQESQDVPYYPQAAEYYCHANDDESQYQEENQHLLLDEEFRRIQGKQQRGREEIHIVDVNADDYGESADLTKSLTEESEYQSHRKKDNMPSSQQKRKKQITYLAFQAKERELTLKNQWANNRMTRKQTQSKYGF